MLHIEQLQLTDLDEFASLHWQLFERFRGHQVMAVLDGCGIPGLPELLDESGLIHTCLFDEPLLEELARAAPYAVVLEPYHPLTQRLLVSDWALTSGIFLLSTQSHQQLFKNLRVLFEQQAVDDQIRLFRFFDPEVFQRCAMREGALEVAPLLATGDRVISYASGQQQWLCFRASSSGEKGI